MIWHSSPSPESKRMCKLPGDLRLCFSGNYEITFISLKCLELKTIDSKLKHCCKTYFTQSKEFVYEPFVQGSRPKTFVVGMIKNLTVFCIFDP